MFPMTITIADTAQLNAVMALLTGNSAAQTAQETAAAPVEKQPKGTTSAATQASAARTRPTAGAAVGGAPEKTAGASAQSASNADSAAQASTAATEGAKTATYQDAAAAVTKLSRVKGRDTAVALLLEFGAAKLPDVKPEQFTEVVTKAEELLEA